MFKNKVEVKGMRGGNGTCIVEKAEDLMMHCKMYARITILPNSSIGMHVHENDEEMVYVISGIGDAYINGEYIQVKAGEAHFAKKGNQHSLINNSEENLVILAVINE